MDKQGEFELALGSAALQYSELMLLVRMAIPPHVDKSDFSIGRLVMDGLTDGRIVELWAKLVAHRHRSSPEVAKSVADMKRKMTRLAEDRNRHLHGLYIPTADRDPVSDLDLRTFERAQVKLDPAGVTVTPANLALLRQFADRCRLLRAEFANVFTAFDPM